MALTIEQEAQQPTGTAGANGEPRRRRISYALPRAVSQNRRSACQRRYEPVAASEESARRTRQTAVQLVSQHRLQRSL